MSLFTELRPLLDPMLGYLARCRALSIFLIVVISLFFIVFMKSLSEPFKLFGYDFGPTCPNISEIREERRKARATLQECKRVSQRYLDLRLAQPDNAYKVKLFERAAENYRDIASSVPLCLEADSELLSQAIRAYESRESGGDYSWRDICDKFRLVLKPLTLNP